MGTDGGRTLDATQPVQDTVEVDLGLHATIAAPGRAPGGDAPLVTANGRAVLPGVETESGALRLVPQEGPRYRQVRPLGAGAMGEVALVEDRDIGRPVAMKRLLAGRQGASAVARFVDEVRTVGKLEHPNIVPIHDVGLDERGEYFFVMKYVEGETLERVLERLRAREPAYVARYGFARRVEIFLAILRALECAHGQGILHRDIKPANVMIGPFGEVVLMDWGVARPIGAGRREGAGEPLGTDTSRPRGSGTQAGTLVGTPLYMSPEQALGKSEELDARSDLYAACVLFHEMLGLRNRYADLASLGELLEAVSTREPPPAMRLFEGAPPQEEAVPAELAHFLHRGLQLDPGARWQSAAEMIDELHAMADGNIRVQCPVTLTKRVARGILRGFDRAPSLALALSAVLLLTLLAVLALAVRGLLA